MSRLHVANRAKYLAYAVAAGAVIHLPTQLAYAMAAAAGAAMFHLTPPRRRAVESNLRHVLGAATPPSKIRGLGRAIYQSAARYYVDLLSAPRLNADQLRRSRVREKGYKHLQAALACGRGVILGTAHYGCPEVALQAAHAWGLDFLVLTEPIEPPELAVLFDRLRASHGHRFVPAGVAGGRAALRTLRRGGVVLLAVDRDIQGHGLEVQYFDAPARMPVGTVELARRTGAVIVPAISHRLPDGTALVTLQEPIELIETGDHQRDTRTNLRRVLERFEPFIRADPAQWLVLEPIWGRVSLTRRSK